MLEKGSSTPVEAVYFLLSADKTEGKMLKHPAKEEDLNKKLSGIKYWQKDKDLKIYHSAKI